MKRLFTTFAFCAALVSASYVHADTEPLEPAVDPIQVALLLTAPVNQQHARTASSGAPSPFSSIKASSAPAICSPEFENRPVFYSYSGQAPAEAPLPSCSADGQIYSVEHPLPAIQVAEVTLDSSVADEVEPGLPDVPIVVNKNVESFIRYFQTSGRKYFEKWLGRSADYMTMLQGILRENGLPEDLSYIALIESGLNPTVRSRANAVGMWQFIRGTATRYGLRVDWWIDERMDPEKATYAAAKYFKNLYGMFGSWYLAAASYNAGEGRVSRAIKKHGTEDFWELASRRKPLHRETREYVPKYLAALTIAKDPELYGFSTIEFSDGLQYEKVKVSQATDLRVIADAAGTSVEEIKRLNPELLRWFTPPNYPDYQIKIPAGSTEQYMENMTKLPPAKRIAFVQHKVKRGETLSKLSKKYGVEKNAITYLNNISSAKKLRPGAMLMIPVRADNQTKKKRHSVAEVITHMNIQS